jgi:hypothetical protein
VFSASPTLDVLAVARPQQSQIVILGKPISVIPKHSSRIFTVEIKNFQPIRNPQTRLNAGRLVQGADNVRSLKREPRTFGGVMGVRRSLAKCEFSRFLLIIMG